MTTNEPISKPADPAAIAARMVREHIGRHADYSDLVLEPEDPGPSDELLDALESALPESARKDVLSLNHVCAIQDAIKAALPESLRARFFGLCKFYNLNASVREEASYLLGVAMGKCLVACSDRGQVVPFTRGAR